MLHIRINEYFSLFVNLHNIVENMTHMRNGWTEGQMDGWTGGWMGGRAGGWMNGSVDGRMGGYTGNVWVDGRMGGWTDGWTDGWVDGRMGGWTDGWTDGGGTMDARCTDGGQVGGRTDF